MTMLRTALFCACASMAAGFGSVVSTTRVSYAHASSYERRPVGRGRSAVVTMDSVASSTYSLDNVVLDGPLQPLNDQILVKLDEREEQTSGGLFLTSTSTDKPTQGTVVASGPGKPHPHSDVLITNPIKAGDRIIFGQYAGTKVTYCLDEHVMLTVDDVLATLVDNEPVPVRDRLMLKPIEKPVETSAGIVLTSEAAKAQEVPNQGEVVAKGEGRFTSSGKIEPVPVEVGDKVMYTKYGGTEIEFNGNKLVFVFAADCLATYK